MPFTPGKSGNPKGRTVGSGIGIKLAPLIAKALEKIPKGQKKTYADLYVEKLLNKAVLDGDDASLKLIINYIDGLPSQPIDLDVTTNGEPIGIEGIISRLDALRSRTNKEGSVLSRQGNSRVQSSQRPATSKDL